MLAWGDRSGIEIFTEAALGNLHCADWRKFAHGRHHWLANRGAQSGIVALASNDDEKDTGFRQLLGTLALADQLVELIAFLRVKPDHVFLDRNLFPRHQITSIAGGD